jgi:hypothetical protein
MDTSYQRMLQTAQLRLSLKWRLKGNRNNIGKQLQRVMVEHCKLGGNPSDNNSLHTSQCRVWMRHRITSTAHSVP